MKKAISLLFMLLLFTSCATVFSHKTQNLEIKSQVENAKVEIQDSTYNLPARIKVKRGKEPLSVKFISDSLQTEYFVEPKHTQKFLYGNLLFTYFAPIGYAVDYTNHRRFFYGKTVFVNNDSIHVLYNKRQSRKKFEIEKGNIFLNASIPLVNSFYIQPENISAKKETGRYGFSIGADYYYRKNKFINFTYSFNTNYEASPNYFYNYNNAHEHFRSDVFMLTHNHNYKRFSFGYGLSYINYRWILHDYGFYDYQKEIYVLNENFDEKHGALGLSFPAYFRIGRFINIGFVYNPTFYTPTLSNKFNYEHVFSFDLKFKIRIKK